MRHILFRLGTPTLLFICLFFASCTSKPTQKTENQSFKLSKSQMIEDFQLFRSIFEAGNAGLYKYHTKDELDQLFDQNEAAISHQTSYREFYNLIWDVIDFSGSCHNTLHYPDSIDASLSARSIFFPLPIKYIDGNLYTNTEHPEIPLGSKITRINGLTATEFTEQVSRFVSTDGHNKTGKYASMETDWLPFYVYLALGAQEIFDITYLTPEATTESTQLPAITYDEFYQLSRKRHSLPYESRHEADYSLQLKENIAVLTVKTFVVGGPDSQEHEQYARFLDSTFSLLRTEKIEKLIVDIRGNGGGQDPNDLLLYSYLTARNFRENTTAHTLFTTVPFQDYYLYDDAEDLAEELREEHSIEKDGKFFQNADFNKIWKPKPLAFQGTIVVLIDPYVASAASLFAGLLKSDVGPIFIGEETLGGYYGHTGHIPMDYELPNSGLVLSFSIVDLEQDVVALKNEKYGDGIHPNIRVFQTLDDFLQHRDTELNFAIEKMDSLVLESQRRKNSID